jgi:hypothetical protein
VCLGVAASAISIQISFALILLSERLGGIAVCGKGPSAVARCGGVFCRRSLLRVIELISRFVLYSMPDFDDSIGMEVLERW